MSSEKFKKFLEAQIRRSPIRIRDEKVFWEARDEEVPLFRPSSLPDLTYFWKEPRKSTIFGDGFRKFIGMSKREIPHDEKDEVSSSQPSDFLESLYFGKKIKDAVVLERGVAVMLQYRLKELENENWVLQRSVRFLRIFLSFAIVASLLLLGWLLSLVC